MDTDRVGNYYPDNRAILGSEYCSGYIDSSGKWNTGFYCPSSDDNINIFCCGTPDNKYCCTKKDQVVQEEVEGITLLLGCMLGVLTACLMVTMAGCLVCPWCPVYRRRRVIKSKSATWNRLSHTDSAGQCSNGDMTTSSTGTQSLYHCSMATPLKSVSRDTVLHSPTLPHSLSDHIGLVTDDPDFNIETIPSTMSVFAPIPSGELHFRNLHYTLPRGAYIVIPHQQSPAPDIISLDPGLERHKSCSEDNCTEDSLLFSTKF